MPFPLVSPSFCMSSAIPTVTASSAPVASGVSTVSGAPTAPTASGASAAPAETPRWFVLRAYKNEKKAEEVLSDADGLPYFIPKQYAVRVYHGRKTRRLVPVIPGLVFVQASRASLCEFKKRHNFLQFVMRTRGAKADTAAPGGRPDNDYLVVPDRQMADFMRVAGQYEENVAYYNPEELHLEKGTRVRILGGLFDGVEGVFLKVQGARARRLVVQIPNTLAAVVSVEPDLVEVIKD